ncbi:pullulanase [Paenibacillus sp. MAHUQ-46]|uniref:Pullulanase n=2 Tax=Paenibacillus TaxID=44249 RepID=A0A934JBD7_9BACL|nr:pullulanase [Paenibacillus roseus]
MRRLNITEYQVELVKDPFGILSGKRYEFLLDLELDEEDELYSPHGIYVKAVYMVDDEGGRIIKHELYERTTNRFLSYDLEDDELAEAEAFCLAHYKETEE